VTADCCRFPGNDPAPGLDGSLPGDYGFDPIGFIQDEESKKWYQQAELIHCRSVPTCTLASELPRIETKGGGQILLRTFFSSDSAAMLAFFRHASVLRSSFT